MKKKYEFLILVFFILFCSSILQAQWTKTNGPIYTPIKNIVVIDSTLFIAAEGKIFRSTNDGQNWTALDESLVSSIYINNITVVNNILCAGGANGTIFWSYNKGVSFNASSFTNNSIEVLMPYTLPNGFGILIGNSTNTFVFPLEGDIYYVYPKCTELTALAKSGNNFIAGTAENGIAIYEGGSWVLQSNTYGSINTFYSNDNYLFVGRKVTGIWRSSTDGESWENGNNGIPPPITANCLTEYENKLYVGTDTGIYVSTNNGSDWTRLTSFYRTIYSVAVYENNVVIGTEIGLFRLTSPDTNWVEINDGLPSKNTRFNCLLNIKGNILTGGNGLGIVLTTNNGDEWSNRSGGIPFSLRLIRDFANIGNNLFVGFQYGSSGVPPYYPPMDGGIYRSSNEGVFWKEVNNGLPDLKNIYCLAVIDTTLFASTQSNGIYRSTDYGDNWIAVNNGLPDLSNSKIYVSGSNIFKINSNVGVYRSTNNGDVWTAVNVGLTNLNVLSIMAMNNIMYLGTTHGEVFRSTDNGDNWSEITNGLPSMLIYSLAKIGNNLFVGGDSGKVFLSVDEGQNWIDVSTGLLHSVVTDFEFNDDYIFVSNRFQVVGSWYEEVGVWRRPLADMPTLIKTGLEENHKNYFISQNYPNPFNPSTNINFNLLKTEFVTLKIYDILGKEVAILINQELNAGNHTKTWDANNLSSGVYFYRLTAGKFTETKKMILVR